MRANHPLPSPLPSKGEGVKPASPEDVAAVLREASEKGWAVCPKGGGTQMRLGNEPRAVDLVLETTALDGVLEYEPADLVVTVQAGMRLGELQRVLGEHGQFLPLDPPLAEQATIGGIIAANSSGPLRLRYGTCRDMLLGIRVAHAGGSISKGGGKVVKNVSGYDMPKLYTGSLGTLGVIVEASFKVMPLPAVESTIVAHFGNLAAAYDAARSIYKAALPVRACELLGGSAARVAAGNGTPTASAAGEAGSSEHGAGGAATEATLAVWIGGGQASVERQKRDVLALCSGAVRSEVIDGEELRRFWRGVEDFGQDEETIAKLSVLPSRTGELLAKLPAGATFVSHVLAGVTYVFGQPAELTAGIAQELGGYCVLEACPPEVKRERDVWGPVGPDFPIMQRLKQEFDPNGILNPGRYVGRL